MWFLGIHLMVSGNCILSYDHHHNQDVARFSIPIVSLCFAGCCLP